MSKEKLIIVTSLDVKNMTDETKNQLIRQTIGFDLTNKYGKIIGKILDIEIVNPQEGKFEIKAEIFDEKCINLIKDGSLKYMKVEK